MLSVNGLLSGSQLYFRIPPLQTQTVSVPLRQKSQTSNY